MQAKNKASFRLVPFYDFWHELATPTAADDDEDNVADLPREYKQTKTKEGTKLRSFVEHSLSRWIYPHSHLYSYSYSYSHLDSSRYWYCFKLSKPARWNNLVLSVE